MSELMPIEYLPDWEQRLQRQDAFWDNEIIDRPVVHIQVGRSNPDYPHPAEKNWSSMRDRWLDAEYVAEKSLANVMNTEFLGDALPKAMPNLGPEVFSAFFGTEMEYGERTSWSIPNLEDWNQVEQLQFSTDNFYWRKLQEMTDALLETGRNKFYTGITDLHPGGDAVAAFRDPQNLAIDMIERPEEVKALAMRTEDVMKWIIDHDYEKLHDKNGQAISTWTGIVSSKKWYIPSNDFSCMISEDMFQDVFLPGIEQECRDLDASIYHLDGPNALRHLDSLLEIDELNAIQWVYGAGGGRASDWMDVYKRCQAAGKGLQLGLEIDELDYFMDELSPEGLWIGLGGVKSREHADELLKKIARWR